MTPSQKPQDGGAALKYASVTTLNRIRAARPCREGWAKLLKHLGKNEADDEPLNLLTVLDINGFDYALWVLSYAMPDDRLARYFQAWCAEQVLHIFEAEHSNDARVRDQIAMLRNDEISATRTTPSTATSNASSAAARASASAAVNTAANAAALAAAWAAASAAPSADASTAAWAATWAAARSDQERQLRKMLAARETQP